MRRLPWLLAAMALAGCVNTSEPGVNIPANAVIYKIAPARLAYDFVDSTAGHDIALTWLPSLGLVGYNCFGFVPHTPTDTVGTFVFATVGPNTGLLERRTGGVTDTTTGFFLPPSTAPIGTHGSYAVNSQGRLLLSWTDGVRSRYFDPSAVLTLDADSVTAHADQTSNADSVHVIWHVVWTPASAC